jgi:hypothetical protein
MEKELKALHEQIWLKHGNEESGWAIWEAFWNLVEEMGLTQEEILKYGRRREI